VTQPLRLRGLFTHEGVATGEQGRRHLHLPEFAFCLCGLQASAKREDVRTHADGIGSQDFALVSPIEPMDGGIHHARIGERTLAIADQYDVEILETLECMGVRLVAKAFERAAPSFSGRFRFAQRARHEGQFSRGAGRVFDAQFCRRVHHVEPVVDAGAA